MEGRWFDFGWNLWTFCLISGKRKPTLAFLPLDLENGLAFCKPHMQTFMLLSVLPLSMFGPSGEGTGRSGAFDLYARPYSLEFKLNLWPVYTLEGKKPSKSDPIPIWPGNNGRRASLWICYCKFPFYFCPQGGHFNRKFFSKSKSLPLVRPAPSGLTLSRCIKCPDRGMVGGTWE